MTIRQIHNPEPTGDSMKNAPRDQIKIEFARRLSAMIAERGWNQTDLARSASKHLPADKEMGRDNVSNYVRGKVIPSPTSLQAIAKALGCKPKDLLPERAARTAEAVAPPLSVTDAGEEGMVWLRVNQRVAWPVALKIIQALQPGDDK